MLSRYTDVVYLGGSAEWEKYNPSFGSNNVCILYSRDYADNILYTRYETNRDSIEYLIGNKLNVWLAEHQSLR